VAGLVRGLDALDGQLQQPGDKQGKTCGADQKERPEKITSAVFAKITYEKEKLLNSEPCLLSRIRSLQIACIVAENPLNLIT
jgi:hypothetical protein